MKYDKLRKQLLDWIIKITKEQELPSSCNAILIGLFNGANGNYMIYFLGSNEFDVENDDWACLSENDYEPRNKYLDSKILTTKPWKEFENIIISEIENIIKNHETILNQTSNIAIGFDDGDLYNICDVMTNRRVPNIGQALNMH